MIIIWKDFIKINHNRNTTMTALYITIIAAIKIYIFAMIMSFWKK